MFRNGSQPCPWSDWQPATMQFCERDVCAVIAHPANTWSNLAYVAVGALVLFVASRERQPRVAPVGVIAILVGIGSFFFHASGTWVGELCDIGAMFLFSSFWLTTEARLVFGIGRGACRALLAGLVISGLAAMLAVHQAGVAVFTLQIVVTFLLDIAWRRRALALGARGPKPNNRPLLALCGAFIVAYIAWRLDYHRIVCDPDNHWLQGHAFWHVTNASCFYFLYRYLVQFGAEGKFGAEVSDATANV